MADGGLSSWSISKADILEELLKSVTALSGFEMKGQVFNMRYILGGITLLLQFRITNDGHSKDGNM